MSGILMGALRGVGKGMTQNAQLAMEEESKIKMTREMAKIEGEINASREAAIVARRKTIMDQSGGDAGKLEEAAYLAGDDAGVRMAQGQIERAMNTDRYNTEWAHTTAQADIGNDFKRRELDLKRGDATRARGTSDDAALKREMATLSINYQSMNSMGKAEEAEAFRQKVFADKGYDVKLLQKPESAGGKWKPIPNPLGEPTHMINEITGEVKLIEMTGSSGMPAIPAPGGQRPPIDAFGGGGAAPGGGSAAAAPAPAQGGAPRAQPPARGTGGGHSTPAQAQFVDRREALQELKRFDEQNAVARTSTNPRTRMQYLQQREDLARELGLEDQLRGRVTSVPFNLPR